MASISLRTTVFVAIVPALQNYFSVTAQANRTVSITCSDLNLFLRLYNVLSLLFLASCALVTANLFILLISATVGKANQTSNPENTTNYCRCDHKDASIGRLLFMVIFIVIVIIIVIFVFSKIFASFTLCHSIISHALTTCTLFNAFQASFLTNVAFSQRCIHIKLICTCRTPFEDVVADRTDRTGCAIDTSIAIGATGRAEVACEVVARFAGGARR